MDLSAITWSLEVIWTDVSDRTGSVLYIAFTHLEFNGHVMVSESKNGENSNFQNSRKVLSYTITWPINSRYGIAINSTDSALSETSAHTTESDHVVALKSKNSEYWIFSIIPCVTHYSKVMSHRVMSHRFMNHKDLTHNF